MSTAANLFALTAGVYYFLVIRNSKDEKQKQKLAQSRQEQLKAFLKHKEANQAGLLMSVKKKDHPIGTKISVKVDEVYLWEIEHLGSFFPSEGQGIENHMHGVGSSSRPLPRDAPLLKTLIEGSNGNKTEYSNIMGAHECVLVDLVRTPELSQTSRALLRAGPRRELHFDPDNVNAAIVTCGGLCPGLNNVVREVTNALYHLYNIQGTVFGIRGGYKGFYDPELPPIKLTPSFVENIHHEGGTVLTSSRGGFDLDKIINFIKKYNIKQLFVIGGDGTHRGAYRIHEGCLENGINVSVAGIPKTIDNDVDYIDRSFGFTSAVEAAQAAIRSAKVEATCNLPHGVGIVKLMGRSAGFIAVHATLGSGDVDLCLVPEVPTVLHGEIGCLPHIYRRVKKQGYAVIVVAEGAGEEILGESAEKDASGNKKLPAIGTFMKEQVESYFESKNETATVKYIDPSYMVRSVPANAADSLYCMQLAQAAVHGSMAGFTGFSVGLCNNKMVFLPIPQLVATSPRMLNPRGRTWERVLARTRQPNTVPSKNL